MLHTERFLRLVRHTCCALLKRWISSKNKTVFFSVKANDFFASSNTARTSLIPDEVALSSLNVELATAARSLASVVFPQPGGPQNMMLPKLPLPIKFIKTEPGFVRCFCPINSLRACGRSLSASGAPSRATGSEALTRFARDCCVRANGPTFRLVPASAGLGKVFGVDDLASRLLPKMGATLLAASSLRRNWEEASALVAFEFSPVTCLEHALSICALMSRSETESEQIGHVTIDLLYYLQGSI